MNELWRKIRNGSLRNGGNITAAQIFTNGIRNIKIFPPLSRLRRRFPLTRIAQLKSVSAELLFADLCFYEESSGQDFVWTPICPADTLSYCCT